jgi:hypothetical protein
MRYAPPDSRAGVIPGRREFVGAASAFSLPSVAMLLEHQGRGAPDVDFGYHAGKVLAVAAYVEYNNR